MRILLAIAIVATCGGCNQKAAQAEDKVKALLSDPESAQFRNVVVRESKAAVCGEVNAKNRMGGYVGFTPFYVRYGVAHIAPSAPIVLTDVDRINATVAEVSFENAHIEACVIP